LECEAARRLTDDPSVQGLLARVQAASGKKDDALMSLEQMKEISKTRYVSAYRFAQVYAALGDKDRAFEWLTKSYQDHGDNISLLRVDPQMEILRRDPRFIALISLIRM